MNISEHIGEQWVERGNASKTALGQTEAVFRLLFERSADAMSLFDPETGRFIESNEAVVRQTGAPNKSALGRVTPGEISPERQPDGRLSSEKAAEMARLALTNGSHRFEWVSRRYDGSEMPLDVVMTAIPVGGRTLLFTVSRDISAHKKAQQEVLRLNSLLEQRVSERTVELVQANEKLKATQEEMRRRSLQLQRHRDVLLELAQLAKSDFHSALQKICAHAAATLDVARVSYWSRDADRSAITCQLLHSNDAAVPDEEFNGARLLVSDCPEYFCALDSNRPVVANDVATHPATQSLSSTYLTARGITSMLDAPVWVRGEVVGVLCHEHTGPARHWTAEEIDFASALATMISLALEESQRARSEQLLRESEARFAAAFRTTPVFITISRLSDGRFIEANDAFVEWSGYRREEILNHSSRDLGLWEDPEERERFWDELRRTRSIHEREVHVRNRSGTIYTLLHSVDVIEINNAPHVLTVGLDITQTKQAEAELIKTLAREKELGQLRSKFVSMVSHEFRTPLGIIQSSAEILEDYLDQLSPEERKEQLQSIQKNTRRMAGIMEEALLMGSLDAGRMEFKPEPTDLRVFAQRLVHELFPFSHRSCPVELVLGDLPVAQSDERLLHHIFSNLLTNAVKYSHAGKAVRFELSRDGGEMVGTVRDEGIGILETDREWLFNAFHRGGNVGDRAGTGLGLVIVKRCVDLHGGKISIESAAESGTTVSVRLPVFTQTMQQEKAS